MQSLCGARLGLLQNCCGSLNLSRDDEPINGPDSPNVSVLCANESEGFIKTIFIKRYTF